MTDGHVPVETLGDWLRPVDIGDTPDTPPSLFEGGIQAGDVLQGALGDCWFLGAISALAPKRTMTICALWNRALLFN